MKMAFDNKHWCYGRKMVDVNGKNTNFYIMRTHLNSMINCVMADNMSDPIHAKEQAHESCLGKERTRISIPQLMNFSSKLLAWIFFHLFVC